MSTTFTTFQGYVNPQDWNAKYFNSTADLTPSGTGTGVIDGSYGFIGHNYSGATAYVLASGIEAGTSEIYVKDVFGGAAGATVTISGAGNQTFDGASTTTITTAYGFKHIANISGVAWMSV
jgi:hypothetical protein